MKKRFISLILALVMMLAVMPAVPSAARSAETVMQTVSLGGNHSAAIKSDGSLWMWGDNDYGQLGDGTEVDQNTPVKIMDNVASVSLGYYHSAAIKSDGSLWMWGQNYWGQLGDGTWDDRYTPSKKMDNVASVSLGYWHSAAIKSDGSLWMWGDNDYGQLGDGTTIDRYTPVKIMDNVVSVSLGYSHSAAIKSDGSLWMWGKNSWGQLGDGTKEYRDTPVKIMDNVVSVSLGSRHSGAIKSDGSLWMWGKNSWGQLGDGTKEYKDTPVKIMDNVVSVSLGGNHSGAIKSDGSLWMWGDNDRAQLGDGTWKDKNTPVNILENVVSVSLGDDHSGAIKSDGSLWMWGYNWDGRLGYGKSDNRYTLVKIMDGVMLPGGGIEFDQWIEDDEIDDWIEEEEYEADWAEYFPESIEAEYGDESDFTFTSRDLDVSFMIGDKKVAELSEVRRDVFDLPFDAEDISYAECDLRIKSPGKTVITATYSDGRVKKCNLTVTGTKILLNDKELTFDQPPLNNNGNLLVPIRAIAEGMGREVLWNDEVKAAFIDNGDEALILPLWEDGIYIANEGGFNTWERVQTNVATVTVNGRTLVPIRQFCEALGAKVKWTDKYKTAEITYDDEPVERMSDSLFDTINFNYHAGKCYSANIFSEYSKAYIDEFYNSRNKALDAFVMGVGEPWEVVGDIWNSLANGDTNASILIKDTLFDVINQIPDVKEADKDKQIDLGLAKDITDAISGGMDMFKEDGGLNADFLKKYPKLKPLNEKMLSVSGHKATGIIGDGIGWGMFGAEELSYILSDYSRNVGYLDAFENAMREQGALDYNMQEAINDLRDEFTEKFVSVLVDLQEELANYGFTKTVSILTGGTYSVGKFIWGQYFNLTGITGNGDALKTFYAIYCYNGALDREFNRVMEEAQTTGTDISYAKALIDFQKATKKTVIECRLELAQFWNKEENTKTGKEIIEEINAWDYTIWKR